MDKKLKVIEIAVAILALLLLVYQLRQFNDNLRLTARYEMVRLARDLEREFWLEPQTRREPQTLYGKMRMAVEDCRPIYRGYHAASSGQGSSNSTRLFSNDEINQYLGFFESVAYYYRLGILDLDIIDQIFGAHIIEAYSLPELRKYIDDIRREHEQSGAFANFSALAMKLATQEDRKDLADLYKRNCRR